MRNDTERARKTQTAILAAAGRNFRTEGYGGAGIDGLARAAGVTNGAFYGHFRTKADAFREVVALGLQELAAGVAAMRASHGADWLGPFVDFYLGAKRTCLLGEACALPMLSAEVARADDAARAVFATEFAAVVAAVAAGLDGDEDRAIGLLALLSGAATLARANPAMGARLAATVRTQALALAGCPAAPPAEPARKRRARARKSLVIAAPART